MPRRLIGLSRWSLENFRREFATVDALPQLCLLAVVSGALTGIMMIAFREPIGAGALFGIGATAFPPAAIAEPGLYIMLGMAAIMALLELTHSPDIILYGMLAVLSAALKARLAADLARALEK